MTGCEVSDAFDGCFVATAKAETINDEDVVTIDVGNLDNPLGSGRVHLLREDARELGQFLLKALR